MRKIILFIHSTLNGVVTGDPSQDKTNFMVWTREPSLEEGSKYLLRTFDTADTILLGRATYEDLSRKWPSISEWPHVSDVVSRLGQKVNNAHKLVVTRDRPVDELAWGKFAAPERLTGTDVEEQIRHLKTTDGGDIVIFGSPTLVRSLTNASLIDEYQIQVHPVVASVGEHLFGDLRKQTDLRLVDVKTLEGGAVLVKYQLATLSS
jgi:dihydrofolate reductase